jgi:hypothetical protein
MRLLEMLTSLDDEMLAELKDEHLGVETIDSRSDVCLSLERELKSPNHVRATVMNLPPPGFCILSRLLDADDHEVAFANLKEQTTEESLMLAARVSSGELAGGDRDRDVYRMVLVEAIRSDLELDTSEIKLLAILRLALGIRTIDHFLMQHHGDFHSFWRTEHAFLDVMRSVRGRGLAYLVDGRLRIPADLVPNIRQILGVEGTGASRRRLLERISNEDLRKTLEVARLRVSGAKEERLQRLLDHYVQPREVLETMALSPLRDLCRDSGIAVSGAKEDLVDRIANHFASGWDVRAPEPAPPPAPPEERILTPSAFSLLFDSLRGEDLSDMLTGIGASRVTGSKESKIALLRDSRFSEPTLLLQLDLKQLEAILVKRRMKTAGSKRDRIGRLLEDAAEAAQKVAD